MAQVAEPIQKLDKGEIERAAAAMAGVDPSAAAGEFEENLRIGVDAANEEAALSPAGVEAVREEFLFGVATRLEADRWIDENPEILDEVVEAPLFLTGLPRSGTTYFQYLFDNDRAMRLLRTWETARPAPAPALTEEERAKRLGLAAVDGEKLRAAIPGFDAMHLNDTDGPDECHKFLALTMGAIGVHNCQNVPSHYRAILKTFDLDAVYRVYKRELQLLQWQSPRRRWALKYPNHLIAMDNIVRIFPDARFVMTHRDPVQTLGSLCKLTYLFRQSRSDHVDPLLVGQQIKEFVRVHFERMMASRRDPEMEKRVIDVDYYRLVAAPDVAMAEIYDKLGLEIPASVQKAVADWQTANPPGRRGSHTYSLDMFGLDPDAVAEEYGHYISAFDVPRETARHQAA
jgi:hypothetical protein